VRDLVDVLSPQSRCLRGAREKIVGVTESIVLCRGERLIGSSWEQLSAAAQPVFPRLVLGMGWGRFCRTRVSASGRGQFIWSEVKLLPMCKLGNPADVTDTSQETERDGRDMLLERTCPRQGWNGQRGHQKDPMRHGRGWF
jgi:hypothetical protein